MKKIVAYARLLRIPGIGGLAMPPVIGAITVGVYDLYNLFIVFLIGTIAAVYGFILNDFADVEVDKQAIELHGKPLVSGDISIKTALIICVFFILFSFLLVVILWYGQTVDYLKLTALISIFTAGMLGSIYDFYGKKIVGADFLVAISVAFVYLFGALSFGQPTIITWIIFILTFNQILHMNAIEGGIKDADHDPQMGVKNITLAMGVKMHGMNITIPNGFKIFSIGIRIFSAVLLFLPFVLFNYNYYDWQLLILGLAIIGVLYYSIKLLSIKIFDRNKIRKYIAIQSFLRFSVVPIMLISIVPSLLYSVILIIFPIAWYIVFTPLIGEKLFRPRM